MGNAGQPSYRRSLLTERELPATVLAVGVVLVVVVFTPFTTDIFMVAKLACLAGATAVSSALNMRLVRQRKIVLRSHPILPYTVAYLAVVVVATVFSRSPLRSLVGGYERFGGLLTVLIGTLFAGNLAIACWGQPHRARRVVAALELGAGIASVYAIFQHFGIDAFTFREQAGNLAKWPGSTLGNSNFLGGLLACTLPLALARALGTRTSPARTKILPLVALATQSLALWFSQSRGGMIGAAVGASTLLVLTSRDLPRPTRRLATATLVGSLAICALAVSAIVSPWTQDLPGPHRKHDVLRSESAVVRGWEWRAATVAAAHRPVFGNGPDSYILAYPPSRVRADGANLGLLISDKPHNLLLEQFASIGIVGTGVWITFIVMIARTAVILRRRSSSGSKAMADGLLATGAAYITTSLFSIDVPPIAMLFWLIGGLVVAISHDETLELPVTAKLPNRSKRVTAVAAQRHPFALPVAISTTVVASVASMATLTFLYSDIRAHAADKALAHQNFRSATRGYNAAAAASPFIAEYRRAAAFGHEQAGLASKNRADRKLSFADSAESLDEALRIEPGNVGYLVARAQLATVQAITIDARLFDDANDRWQRAVEVDPHDVELRRAFATALETSARATRNDQALERAIDQYTAVTELRPDDDYAWLQLGQQQLRAKHYDDAIASAQRALTIHSSESAVLLIFEAAHQAQVATGSR